jgi:hypothetical protein
VIALALAVMLQSAPLVHYDDLPNYSKADIGVCSRQYDRLERFVTEFKSAVFNREIGRGGKLEWSQAEDIRFAAVVKARPYLERIRYIAWQGRAPECRALADKGISEVTEGVIRPVFGHR